MNSEKRLNQKAAEKGIVSEKIFTIYRIVIVIALIALTSLTIPASLQFGTVGIFQQALQNAATTQIFVDLIIAICLISVWIWFDAKKHNRMFWPWFIISLAIGSYGPLLYLLFRKRNQF